MIENPFTEIDRRFNRIESLIVELRNIQQHSSTHPDDTDQLLSISEASKLLKLAIPTLYSKVSRNEIPVSRSHGKLYFSKKILIEWAMSGYSKTVTELANEAIDLPQRKGGRK